LNNAPTSFKRNREPSRRIVRLNPARFHIICAFNGVGEACAKYLQKGDGIFVEGRLQVRQYDSKQNGKEVSVEIIPSTVRFLGSGRNEGAERPTPSRPPAGTREAADGADGSDPDVPF
jgi:single-stranded DNA-binding protein